MDAIGYALADGLSIKNPSYTNKAAAPNYQNAPAEGIVLNGLLYCAGDLVTHEAYDPVADSWTSKGRLNDQRYACAGASVGGKNYVFGGYYTSEVQTAEVYDPSTNAWSYIANYPVAVDGVTATGHSDGYIYVGGGQNGSTEEDNFYQYRPSSNTYYAKALFPVPLTGARLVSYNGFVWLHGGYYAQKEREIYQYDTSANTWTTKASSYSAMYFHALCVVGDKIYAFGGGSRNVEEYDPSSNTWSHTRVDLPYNWDDMAFGTIDGKIYAAKGYNNDSNAEVLDTREIDVNEYIEGLSNLKGWLAAK